MKTVILLCGGKFRRITRTSSASVSPSTNTIESEVNTNKTRPEPKTLHVNS